MRLFQRGVHLKVLSIRNIIAVIGLVASFVLIAQYQNCAPASGSGALSLGTNSSSSISVPFSVSALSMPSSTVQVSLAIVASSQIFGKDSDQPAQCTWLILNASNNAAVGSPYMNAAASGSCSLPANALLAPAAVGSYILVLTATNSLMESATTQAAFQTQSGAVPMGVANSLTANRTSGVYVGDIVAFTGRANSNQSANLSVVMGSISAGVKTAFTGAGCSAAAAGTSVQASCSISMSTIGIKTYYVDSYVNGVLVKSCTASTTSPDLSCTGNFVSATYSITVLSSGGGGGGGCLLSRCTY
jgi:hypothetical protein